MRPANGSKQPCRARLGPRQRYCSRVTASTAEGVRRPAPIGSYLRNAGSGKATRPSDANRLGLNMGQTDFEIRPFLDRDHAAVVALWEEVFAGDPSWNAPAETIRRKSTVQPELFLVAHAKEKVVGTVMAGFDGVRGWIHHLAVCPSLRRRGVATRLMQAAEDGLANLGCPKVNLQVRSTNPGVIAFYQTIC